jgi:hypothetical protein
MKRKQLLAALISLGILGSALAGCGSSDSGTAKSIVPEAESAAAESTAAESGAEESTSDPENAPAADGAENPAVEPVSIEEQVLVDQDGIRITAQEYVTDGFLGDGIRVLLENDSEEDRMISCNALIVNDYMITDLFTSEVAAGKKSNETIELMSSELEAAGIDPVGKVEIYFNVFDPATYETVFATDCCTIETSQFANMDTVADETGTELYNEGGVRIVGKAVDENSFWGTAILLYAENNSGRNVVIQADDLSINGFMMTPYFSATVYDGKKIINTIDILSTELEENGITSVEDVELKFHILDEETYDTIAESDVISFSAK